MRDQRQRSSESKPAKSPRVGSGARRSRRAWAGRRRSQGTAFDPTRSSDRVARQEALQAVATMLKERAREALRSERPNEEVGKETGHAAARGAARRRRSRIEPRRPAQRGGTQEEDGQGHGGRRRVRGPDSAGQDQGSSSGSLPDSESRTKRQAKRSEGRCVPWLSVIVTTARRPGTAATASPRRPQGNNTRS